MDRNGYRPYSMYSVWRRNKMNEWEIDGYYISDDNELHTYIGNEKHFVISDVKTDKQANEIIKELNKESEEEQIK